MDILKVSGYTNIVVIDPWKNLQFLIEYPGGRRGNLVIKSLLSLVSSTLARLLRIACYLGSLGPTTQISVGI